MLLGAVGGPKWDTPDPAKPRPEQGLLGVRKGLGLLFRAAKSAIESLPTGRKSVARVLPPPTGHEEQPESIEKKVADAPTTVDALKALNEHHWGIPANK